MTIPLFLLVGPTASGKTEVAIHLAQELDAEIISTDSMQIYRGMDIGTAKPSVEIRQRVPHHLIDICDPWEPFNAASFVECASQVIAEIYVRNKKALLVGGTALYIKSLLEGLFPGPSANWEIRNDLMKRPVALLYEELLRLDPDAAHKIYAQDMRRIVRALEVYYATGIPISVYQKQLTKKGDYRPVFVGLLWEKTVLRDRIDRRVDEMLQQGLIEETKKLLALPHPLSQTAAQAIGYKEVIAALGNPALLPQLTDTIKTSTRQFAKRQMTWLRRFPVHWLTVTAQTGQQELAHSALLQFCQELV